MKIFGEEIFLKFSGYKDNSEKLFIDVKKNVPEKNIKKTLKTWQKIF